MPPAIRQETATTGENLYWPLGVPEGGFICLHGSEGGWAGWNDVACALFAGDGFVALSRNYTRTARPLTWPDIDDVPLEGTQAALAAVRAAVAPFRCGTGLYGISRGAEHALLLTQLLAEDGCHAEIPAAVAVHSPPDTGWPAFIVADVKTGGHWTGDADRPAWS